MRAKPPFSSSKPREHAERRLKHEVVVVPHQAVREHDPPVLSRGPVEQTQEQLALDVVVVDRLLVVAPRGDVVDAVRDFDAGRSRHSFRP
jgi:hypothetical protein